MQNLYITSSRFTGDNANPARESKSSASSMLSRKAISSGRIVCFCGWYDESDLIFENSLLSMFAVL